MPLDVPGNHNPLGYLRPNVKMSQSCRVAAYPLHVRDGRSTT